MPEPTSVYSTDKYIYKYIINPFSSKICFLEPNYITMLAIFLTIPVVYGLLNNWSTLSLVLLVMFRAFLDCLDGSVARNCNKLSDFGHKLDQYGDVIFNTSFFFTLLYILYNKSDINKYIGIIIILLLYLLNNIIEYDWIYGDNIIIYTGLLMYIFKIFNNSII
jgi:phosphatidylglycerophosphate synthase